MLIIALRFINGDLFNTLHTVYISVAFFFLIPKIDFHLKGAALVFLFIIFETNNSSDSVKPQTNFISVLMKIEWNIDDKLHSCDVNQGNKPLNIRKYIFILCTESFLFADHLYLKEGLVLNI